MELHMSVKYLNIWYIKENDEGVVRINEDDYRIYSHFGIASRDRSNRTYNDEFQIKIEWNYKW